MTGSTSDEGRVVVMDGFAGRGRYPDGTPASAELIMQAVRKLQSSRKVATFFVEKNKGEYQKLDAVVREYAAKGLLAKALPGSADTYLDTVIDAARGVPLFLFLDPCGALLPFMRLARLVGNARRVQRPQTEVLLNFSANFTRRAAGQLAAGRLDEAGVSRLDTTCGSPWWRDEAMKAIRSSTSRNFEPAAEAVVKGYAERLARAGGMLYVTVPVRKRLRLQPIYHLVFLTRSTYGLWVFADALGKARQEWLKAIGILDDDEEGQITLPGFSNLDSMQRIIRNEKTRAQEIIEANIRRLLSNGESFRLINRTQEVFGEAYGIATDLTVASTIRALNSNGELTIYKASSRIREYVVGPPGQTVT